MDTHKSLNELDASWAGFSRPQKGDRYQHYKGGQYEIVETGFLEATEEPCVIYQSLQNGSTWVRTAQNFLETIEFDGKILPRFRLL
jgi:hypothetical protein